MGPEQPPVVDVEGVLGIASRVSGRLIDQGEVVPVVFHLRPVDGLEAELAEDPPYLTSGERHRAQAAAAERWRRPGQIKRLGLQALRACALLDGALALVEGIGDP